MACDFEVPRRTVYPVKAPFLSLLVELPHEAATWSGRFGLRVVNLTTGLTLHYEPAGYHEVFTSASCMPDL